MFSKPLPCILLFGPSRAGKSSFINTLARKTLASVGGSSNESTTSSVISYNFTVKTQNNNNFLDVLLIDTPGIYDSMLRMSKAEITARIEEKMLSLTTQDSLSCILVFESLFSEPTHIRRTLSTLEELLGSNFKQSVIVILTKADIVLNEEDLEGAKKTAEGICEGLGIPYIYWMNNHHQFTVDEGVFSRQMGELKNKMSSVFRYFMKEVKDYRGKIEERARVLESSTPKKKRIEQFEVFTKEFQPYTVPVTKYRTAYREDAKRRGGLAGLFGGWKTVIEPYTQSYIEHETRFKEVEVKKIQKKEIEVPFGPDHFINLAKSEIFKELRDKYRKI